MLSKSRGSDLTKDSQETGREPAVRGNSGPDPPALLSGLLVRGGMADRILHSRDRLQFGCWKEQR